MLSIALYGGTIVRIWLGSKIAHTPSCAGDGLGEVFGHEGLLIVNQVANTFSKIHCPVTLRLRHKDMCHPYLF